MPRCNINLAEELIWSPKKRRMAHHLLILYLFTTVLVIYFLCAHSMEQVLSGIRYLNQSRALDQKFIQSHPDEAGLDKHAKQLKTRLEQDAARIESINSTLPPAIHTPLPALFLLANQPGKTMLYSLSFAQQTADDPVQFHFDLISPLHAAGTASSTRDFLEQWAGDPNLSRQFPVVTQLQVRRAKVSGKPVNIAQYEAVSKD